MTHVTAAYQTMDAMDAQVLLINPRHACAASVTVVVLCVCVCLSVYLSVSVRSGTTGIKQAYE